MFLCVQVFVEKTRETHKVRPVSRGAVFQSFEIAGRQNFPMQNEAYSDVLKGRRIFGENKFCSHCCGTPKST